MTFLISWSKVQFWSSFLCYFDFYKTSFKNDFNTEMEKLPAGCRITLFMAKVRLNKKVIKHFVVLKSIQLTALYITQLLLALFNSNQD